MRRTANLFDRIYEPENLRLAFHKAAMGRRGQSAVKKFPDRLDERIGQLSQDVRDGTIQVGRFQQFLIRDPKERVITAPCFDERVLHHAIMNLCEPSLLQMIEVARNRSALDLGFLRQLFFGCTR